MAGGDVGGGFAVRTKGNPLEIVPFAREQARALDPFSPLHNVMTLETRVWRSMARPRFYAVVLGLFAALALLTALVGIYGVLAHAVERRRGEFGIRRALGAEAGDVLRLVLGRGLMLTVIGLLLGVLTAVAGARVLRSLLFGIGPGDPATFAGVSALVVCVAAAACYVPARRAMSVEPTEALRVE